MALLDEGAKKKAERPRHVPKIAPELEVLLSAEDIARIREDARKQVAAEKKREAETQYLAKVLEEERRLLEPAQELVDIVIDVAPFAKNIMVDGVQYFQGQYYRVARSLYNVLIETMARSWAHDEEVGSPNRRFYEKPSHLGTGNYVGVQPMAKDTMLSPRTPDGVSVAQRLRVG